MEKVHFEEHLGRNRRLSLKDYKGRTLLHLRIYEENGYPTKKGVFFTVQEGKKLIELLPEVAFTLDKEEPGFFKVSDQLRIEVTEFGTVDVRLYWKPEEEYVPTKKGVNLRKEEFFEFLHFLNYYKLSHFQ